MTDTKIEPMLAESSNDWEEVFNTPGYAYEIKYDGVRCIVEANGGNVALWSRTGKPLTYTFPEVAEAIGRMMKLNDTLTRLVLDGEIIAFKNGEVSFNQVQQRLGIKDAARIKRLTGEIPAKFVAFDILYDDIHPNLHASTYEQRRKVLEQLNAEDILVSKMYTDGRQLLKEIREKGIEGIMAKRINGQYHFGKRNAAWVKIKPVETADCIVCGYTMGTGKRDGMIGALVLEQLDQSGMTVFVGKVGTGFNDKQLAELTLSLGKLVTGVAQEWRKEVGEDYYGIPFDARPVCEVEYLMKSKDGILRFPSYKGMRIDKLAKDCLINGRH